MQSHSFLDNVVRQILTASSQVHLDSADKESQIVDNPFGVWSLCGPFQEVISLGLQAVFADCPHRRFGKGFQPLDCCWPTDGGIEVLYCFIIRTRKKRSS